MANKLIRKNDMTNRNTHYAWLERTRGLFREMAQAVDEAALEGIIAEGNARLAKLDGRDMLLGGYVRLAVAEAYFQLALDADLEIDALAGVQAGRDLCEEAVKSASAGDCGTAAMVLPRAITLLSALYSAMPAMDESGLDEQIAVAAKTLDAALAEQEVLRELGLEKEEQAKLLLGSMDGLVAEERQEVLLAAADLLLAAGNLYLQAGDTTRVALVQEDLTEVDDALSDPSYPLPQLKDFSEPVPAGGLMPSFAQDAIEDSDDEVSQPEGGRNGGGGLRKVISAAGMVISLGMMAYSGWSLFTRVFGQPDKPAEDIPPAATENTLALTQIAIEAQLTAFAQESVPGGTPVPEGTSAADSIPQKAQNTAEAELPIDSGVTQSRNAFSFYDDFSSNALGWPLRDDGSTLLQMEGGRYRFQHKKKGDFDTAFWPVDFIPVEAWFDVQAQEGNQDGTFGVFCMYNDQQNYYYVEFDLLMQQYTIAQNANGTLIPLTAQNENGTYWLPAAGLNPGTGDMNRIGITCYPETITLFINGSWVDEVQVAQPTDLPGSGAFLVYTFDFAGDEGYTVWFDNVELWEPVQ